MASLASGTFANARLVLADEIVDGSVHFENGLISGIDAGSAAAAADDFEGDFLLPGLVELHTDHLESHYHPRPLVFWDPMAALQSHDAQVAASGITTVFDALRLGSDPDDRGDLGEHAEVLLGAIQTARADKRLRADHFVHLRCELSASDALDHFESFHGAEPVKLASLMDHTPGQRQFVTMDLYYAYYQGKTGRSDAEMERFIEARLEDQRRYAGRNRRGIVDLGKRAGLALASHDDATAEHIEEAMADGVAIAEFPTTADAASAARVAGLAILMGAPNIVRGRSHSGNVSATDLARQDRLDVLSSDYVPFSLMQAAFALPRTAENISLPEAVAKVSRNPARAAGLEDRGEIATGQRADLVRVALVGGMPVVRAVWRQGTRVI